MKINFRMLLVLSLFSSGAVFADVAQLPHPVFQVSIPQIVIRDINFQQIPMADFSIPTIRPNFSVNIPQIGNFSFTGMTEIPFQNIPLPAVDPPIVGVDVNKASLIGMRFDDVYIANPENQPGTKSVAELAARDFARFGITKPAESELEASLFPNANKPMVADNAPPLPLNLFSIDACGTES